ncbi:MAG TPA: serine/threonine-protein kinase [Vicinamibacterales bacterium]|nr:serine/threonine-protein kinase [Vicinamibacterales bacterium]
MDAAGWQRAKPIIEEALHRPPDARRAFVESACADAALCTEIVALLESYALEDEQPLPHAQSTQSDLASEVSAGAGPPVTFEFSPGLEVGDRYVLVAPLGKGGGGEVHRARDQRLQRDVAIKILPPRGGAEDSRRIREARAAAQLNHRGIATIHDVFDLDGRACIVMELVDGDTLAQRIRDTPFALDEVVRIGVQIADAVEHAHACGILHCDLKPANVKFAADGTIKVLDFGLARRTEQSAAAVRGVTGLTAGSLDGLALGTPGYMSPEQLLGLPIDFRSDVYSLGVIVYEMATGQRLFDGSSVMSTAVAVLSAPVPDLPRRVSRRLRTVIHRALSRKPEDRYPSAAELRDALAAVPRAFWRNLVRQSFV